MGTESITFAGREFHATKSTMQIWLRLLAINLHYCDPKLSKVQSDWIDASHDLECFMISLDGLEEHFPKILKATEGLIQRIEKCGDEIDGAFLNLLGFTNFFFPEGVRAETQHILKAGYAFRALLVGDESKSMPIKRGEQAASSNH
jgi:hypothetical protein